MKQLVLIVILVLAAGSSVAVQAQVTDTSGELIKVYVRQDPATYKKEKDEGMLDLEFAVQLSASSRPITDKSSLKSWEELGPLYIHEENGLYKVRIGPFNTQDKAKEVLLQAKQRGKKDAFIVIQKGLENYKQPEGLVNQEVIINETEPTKQANPPVPATKVIPAPAPVLAPEEEAGAEYKVRLASFLKPGGFNTKDVDQYGPLESYRMGEWTIMMIGGFTNKQEATKVRDQVIAKGYKDAAVVIDRGGIIEDVHD